MSKVLPGEWGTRVRKIAQDQPFVWCWDFPLQVSISTNTRTWLTPYPSPITLLIDLTKPSRPYSPTGTAHAFQPFPIEVSDIDENAEGDLPQLQIAVGNQTRFLAKYFEIPPEEEALVGSVVYGFLVNLYDTTQFLTYAFRCKQAVLTNEVCTLHLEFPSPLKRRVPQDRVNPSLCRLKFGTGTTERPSPCGYVINAVAAFTTCGRTLPDCIARGADEAARNIPVLHPQRFSGFLGVPQQ